MVIKKFKIGDKVKIASRKTLIKYENESPCVISEMFDFVDKIATITSVNDEDGWCRIDIDLELWKWSKRFLTKIKIKKISFNKYKKGEEYI